MDIPGGVLLFIAIIATAGTLSFGWWEQIDETKM